MSDNNQHHRFVAQDFLTWLSLGALAINIVEKIQSLLVLPEWSSWLLAHWSSIILTVRTFTRDIAVLVFDIEPSWVSIRLVPTLLVLIAIALLGLRRRIWLMRSLPLGSAISATGNTVILTVLASALILLMLALEQSYFPLNAQVPDTAREFFVNCYREYQFSLVALCIFTTYENPVLQEVLTNFQAFDWIVLVTYLVTLVFVLSRHQAEVIFAFVLALAIAVIGSVSI
jgi:hypothetical protein